MKLVDCGAELIAHRGVHQTYHRGNLTNETCTAKRIYTPTHEFIENTVKSIEYAFELGATVVELDVHPTSEPNGMDFLQIVYNTNNTRYSSDAFNYHLIIRLKSANTKAE